MKGRLLVAVVALQAAWVVATVARQEMLLSGGTAVLLETVPDLATTMPESRRPQRPQGHDPRTAQLDETAQPGCWYPPHPR